MANFLISDRHRIPFQPGQAIGRGWPRGRPFGVTWHWTATATLAHCTELLGGARARRRGIASAHYAIGRSFAEGVERYVSLEDRSWHAGKNQTQRWDGGPYTGARDKGARTTIGVETVNIGYARRGHPAAPDWLRVDHTRGRWRMRVEPWTEEQVAMMIAIGREIVSRWPEIRPRHHHGHHDLCPDYKVDPLGFPFARVLRGIYDDPAIPDVWTPFWTVPGRRRALDALGYGPLGAGGLWDRRCDRALRAFQRREGLVVNGHWTTFVNWRVYDRLASAHRWPQNRYATPSVRIAGSRPFASR